MNKVPYHAIGTAIKTHCITKLTADSKQDIYLVTHKYSACIMGNYPVSILVRFLGMVPDPALSQTSDSLTRDAEYGLFFISDGEDDEKVDELIDQAITDFEYYLSYPNQGAYIFGESIIEWAAITSFQKHQADGKGIFAHMQLTVRIMEV